MFWGFFYKWVVVINTITGSLLLSLISANVNSVKKIKQHLSIVIKIILTSGPSERVLGTLQESTYFENCSKGRKL